MTSALQLLPSFLEDNTLHYDSMDDLLFQTASQLRTNPSIKTFQTLFNASFSLSKLNPNVVPSLLEKHSEATFVYQTTKYTQQADAFLQKLASYEKISSRLVPVEFKTKLPLYQLLISLAKIFMLSEFEITALGCAFDCCSFDINEALSLEEGEMLRKFPLNFVLSNLESKRLVMYLLMMTFSVKQYLHDNKEEMKSIQAYCEKICEDFSTIYNKWVKMSEPYYRFKFSIQKMNKKFHWLAEDETKTNCNLPKDYNKMVDEILESNNCPMTNKEIVQPFSAQLNFDKAKLFDNETFDFSSGTLNQRFNSNLSKSTACLSKMASLTSVVDNDRDTSKMEIADLEKNLKQKAIVLQNYFHDPMQNKLDNTNMQLAKDYNFMAEQILEGDIANLLMKKGGKARPKKDCVKKNRLSEKQPQLTFSLKDILKPSFPYSQTSSAFENITGPPVLDDLEEKLVKKVKDEDFSGNLDWVKSEGTEAWSETNSSKVYFSECLVTENLLNLPMMGPDWSVMEKKM